MDDIDVNSWHYKLIEKVYGHYYFFQIDGVRKQVSLCKYFWSTFLGCILYIVWVPIKYIFVKPSIFISKRVPKTDFNTPEISEKTKNRIGYGLLVIAIGFVGFEIIIGLITNFWITVALLAFVGSIIGVCIGIASLIDYIKEQSWLRINGKMGREPKISKQKTQNIFDLILTYIRSHKEKVCPFLTFKE